MRLLALFAVAACTRSAPPPTIASHRQPEVAVDATRTLIERRADLIALPPLPEKRGIDLAGERNCRAHLARVERYDAATHLDDVQRLVRVAILTGGDCRIDTDAFFAAEVPHHVGGCTGATIDDALLAWKRVAAVATTRARRAAALRNLAVLAWAQAQWQANAALWIEAGDAYVRAARSSPDAGDLSASALDAYENALRVRIRRAEVARIARGLDAIVDGSAGDRARVLRTRLVF